MPAPAQGVAQAAAVAPAKAAGDGGHLAWVAAQAAAVDPMTGRVSAGAPNKRCPCPNCRPSPAPGAGKGAGKGAGSYAANVGGTSGAGAGQRQQPVAQQKQQQQGGRGRSDASKGGKGGAERKPSFNVKALPGKPLMAAPTGKEKEAQSPKAS